MSGRDNIIRSQIAFCCDYGLVLNQNLVQDVQGLSLSHPLKIAGPKNVFIDLDRPKVELNLDRCIFFGAGVEGGGGGDLAIGDIWLQNHHILICYFTSTQP